MGVKQLTVRVGQDLYERLVSVAVRRYGKVRGGIQKVVEEAILEYLAKVQRDEGRADTG